MKKIAVLTTAAIILLCVLCSCTATEDDTAQTTTALSTQDESTTKFSLENSVVGKITKVSGNQITIDVGTVSDEPMTDENGETVTVPDDFNPEDFSMPEGASMPDKGSLPEGESMPERGSLPEGESMPERSSLPEGESMPERSSLPEGESMPDRGSLPDGMGGGFGGMNVNIEYTGESAVYTIPMEISVGNSDYSSLSENMVVALTLDESSTVTAVTIISR